MSHEMSDQAETARMTKEIAHTRDLLQEIAEDVRGRGGGPHAGPRGGKFHSMHERSSVGTDLSSESWPSRSGDISEPRVAASNGGAPHLRNASTQLPRHQLFIIVNRFVFEDSVQEQIKYRVLLVKLICIRWFRFDRVLSILARLGSCRDVHTFELEDESPCFRDQESFDPFRLSYSCC